jgi:hypothetical protein
LQPQGIGLQTEIQESSQFSDKLETDSLSNFELFFFVPCGGGLVAYFASLLLSNEITRQDVAVVVPWKRVKPYEASGG